MKLLEGPTPLTARETREVGIICLNQLPDSLTTTQPSSRFPQLVSAFKESKVFKTLLSSAVKQTRTKSDLASTLGFLRSTPFARHLNYTDINKTPTDILSRCQTMAEAHNAQEGGGDTYIIKAHGMLQAPQPGQPLPYVDLSLYSEHGINLKVFTYTDPGGLTCTSNDSLPALCSGQQEVRQRPASHAYDDVHTFGRIFEQPSTLKVYSAQLTGLPDILLFPFSQQEAARSKTIPGGVYLCPYDSPIIPFDHQSTPVTLTQMIEHLLSTFVIPRNLSRNINIHLIACLAAGLPSGTGLGASMGLPDSVHSRLEKQTSYMPNVTPQLYKDNNDLLDQFSRRLAASRGGTGRMRKTRKHTKRRNRTTRKTN